MARPLPLLLFLAALGAGCRAGSPPAGTAGPSAEPLQDEADNQENILSQVAAEKRGRRGAPRGALGTRGAALGSAGGCCAQPAWGWALRAASRAMLGVHARRCWVMLCIPWVVPAVRARRCWVMPCTGPALTRGAGWMQPQGVLSPGVQGPP